MSIRWYNILVLLFWVATMSWLLTEKVLPPLLIGDPPSYSTMVEKADGRKNQHVSWQLLWSDKPLGWASNETLHRENGAVEFRSRVHVRNFPLRELPRWFAPLFEKLGGARGELDVDIDGRTELLPSGRLKEFGSIVTLGDLQEAIRLHGIAKGNKLEVTVEFADFKYTTSSDLIGDLLIGDGLAPRTRMAGLRVGQQWTEPVYSPFHPPNSPMHILQVKVEREEPIPWDGEMVGTKLVVYRNDSGSELVGSTAPRGRVWVRDDGTVLKQEAAMLGSTLVFVRRPLSQMRVRP